jgi:hypothetical protein
MQPKEIGLPFTAYTAIDEVREVSRQQAKQCSTYCLQPAGYEWPLIMMPPMQ